MSEFEPTLGEVARICTRIESSLTKFQNEVEDKYVTKDSFAPVKLITYGLVGAILMAVIGAILSLVL